MENVETMEHVEMPNTAAENPVQKTVEEWAEELGVPLWLLYAARIQHSWPYGKILSREEFERAMKQTRLIRVG